MTKKRRRKRPPARPATAAGTSAPAEEETVAADRSETEVPAKRPEEASPQRGWGAARPSPYPPLGVSLARGLRAVGGSPVTLGAVFLSALATWIAFLLMGPVPNPQFMAAMTSIPPVHAYFPDLEVVFQYSESAMGTLWLIVALGLLRSITFGTLLLLIDSALKTGRPDVRGGIRRLPKLVVTLFAIYVVEVTLAVVVQQLVGATLGPQGLILAVIASLYFLAMVPIVAAAEDAAAQESLRRGFRAARLPGTRHLGLVLTYYVVLLSLSFLVPGAVLAPATPGFLTWLFVLLATFVQIGVLAAFHYRWLAVRDEVPAPEPVPRAGRSSGGRGRGRRP